MTSFVSSPTGVRRLSLALSRRLSRIASGFSEKSVTHGTKACRSLRPRNRGGARVHRQQVVQRAHRRPRATRSWRTRARRPPRSQSRRSQSRRRGVGEERGGVRATRGDAGAPRTSRPPCAETPAEERPLASRRATPAAIWKHTSFFAASPAGLRGPGEDRAVNVPTLKRALGGDAAPPGGDVRAGRRFFVFRLGRESPPPLRSARCVVRRPDAMVWASSSGVRSDGVGRLARLAARSFANERALVLRVDRRKRTRLRRKTSRVDRRARARRASGRRAPTPRSRRPRWPGRLAVSSRRDRKAIPEKASERARLRRERLDSAPRTATRLFSPSPACRLRRSARQGARRRARRGRRRGSWMRRRSTACVTCRFLSPRTSGAAPSSTRGAAPRFFETRRSYVALASSLHGTSVAEKGTARAPSASSKARRTHAPSRLERDARAGGVAGSRTRGAPAIAGVARARRCVASSKQPNT